MFGETLSIIYNLLAPLFFVFGMIFLEICTNQYKKSFIMTNVNGNKSYVRFFKFSSMLHELSHYLIIHTIVKDDCLAFHSPKINANGSYRQGYVTFNENKIHGGKFTFIRIWAVINPLLVGSLVVTLLLAFCRSYTGIFNKSFIIPVTIYNAFAHQNYLDLIIVAIAAYLLSTACLSYQDIFVALKKLLCDVVDKHIFMLLLLFHAFVLLNLVSNLLYTSAYQFIFLGLFAINVYAINWIKLIVIVLIKRCCKLFGASI